MDKIFEPFTYDFMLRALAVGLLTAVCSSLLGVVLVLKRLSMIGDGLSHVGFGILAVATALNLAPMRVAVVGVMICAYLIMRLGDSSRMKGDAVIALISSGALAVGILVSSFGKGANIDLNSYLFGSILATGTEDVILSAVMGVCVVTFFILYYNKIFSLTFDEGFSKACGMNVKLYNTIISLLTAFTVVIGMRLMGTLLISSFLVFPPLCAMRICKRFKGVVTASVIIAVSLVLTGLFLTYYFDLPTGASIVCTGLALYLILLVFDRVMHFINKRIGKEKNSF